MSDQSGLRIFVGTANLGNSLPDEESLSCFLPYHGKAKEILGASAKSSGVVEGVSKKDWNGVDAGGRLEIFALGFQEATDRPNAVNSLGLTSLFTGVSVSKGANPLLKVGQVLGKAAKDTGELLDSGGTNKLKGMLRARLGDEYKLLSEFQRGEMVLYLFVRKDLAAKCEVLASGAENTGLGGIGANKGGIAVRMRVGTTVLAFVSMHLAAHEGRSNYEARNANVEEILLGTKDQTLLANHSFVLGDLNYRCNLPNSSRGQANTKDEMKFISQKMVQLADWKAFNDLDELTTALADRKVLVGFQTPRPKFPPTFKLERKTGCHYNFQRVPSYTDRILWKSNEETRDIEPIIYESVTKFTSSDHKPVRGLFFLPSRSMLNLDAREMTLHLTISRLQVKALKAAASLVQNDLDTHLRIKCDPPKLEKNTRKDDQRTVTIKNSDRPFFRKDELKMQIRVAAKNEDIYGAQLYIESVQSCLTGDSVLGTAVLDLEHIVRTCLGSGSWSEGLTCELLRGGNGVGKVSFDLHAGWGSSSSSSSSLPAKRGGSSSSYHKKESAESALSKESTSSLESGGARAQAKKSTVKDSTSNALSQYLARLDLPQGILPAVLKDFNSLDRRVFMIENSVEMQANDAFLLKGENTEKVTRWDELTEYVTFHSKMAARCGISTKFDFLNNPDTKGFGAEGERIPQEFTVGGTRSRPEELEQWNTVMETVIPSAPFVPLVDYVHNFSKKLKGKHESYLKQRKKFVCLSIATQGMPTPKDGQSESDAFRDLRQELFELVGLPVKVTVRLCTNDEETFRRYNKLDSILEYCDVLDDFEGESMEVYLYNPWLTYSLGLHRLREAGLGFWGTVGKLDEKTFTFDEIHKLCTEFFGMDKRDLPHPRDDWNGFVEALHQLNKRESPQYSAVKKRKTSWIDVRKLESMNNRSKSSGSRTSRKSSQSRELTLDDYIHHWAYHSSDTSSLRSLAELLVTVTDTFPPNNETVEPHDYLSKWRPLAEDVFDECGDDELRDLLKRSLKKMKMFLHPDYVPSNLTDRQIALIGKLRSVFKKSEQLLF